MNEKINRINELLEMNGIGSLSIMHSDEDGINILSGYHNVLRMFIAYLGRADIEKLQFGVGYIHNIPATEIRPHHLARMESYALTASEA